MSPNSDALRVVIITSDAILQGTVPSQAPGGQPARFLDILRSPSRVGQGAIGAKPGLTLRDVVRKPRGGGEEMTFDQPVVLRLGSILAAYDLGASRSAPNTQYEQLRGSQQVRARIFLEGHLALEANLAGGLRTIDAVRGETFVACTDVQLLLSGRQRLPFLAVNSTRIESFSILEAGEG